MPIIIENILALCKKRKLTVTRLEAESGLPKSAVSKWVKSSPNLSSLIKISRYLNVPLSTILKGVK